MERDRAAARRRIMSATQRMTYHQHQQRHHHATVNIMGRLPSPRRSQSKYVINVARICLITCVSQQWWQ